MRNLEKLKLRDKTALPAFLQKLYIYSIMSPRATLAISNFFSKKNTSKHFCSNILHIIYIIFFQFFLPVEDQQRILHQHHNHTLNTQPSKVMLSHENHFIFYISLTSLLFNSNSFTVFFSLTLGPYYKTKNQFT